MSLATFTTVRPGITNQVANPSGSIQGNVVEEIDSMVENTLYGNFVLKDYFDLRTLSKTNMLQKYSSGAATVRRHTPGTTPDGVRSDFGKNVLTVDVHSFIRNTIPVLDDLTVPFEVRSEIAKEQGMGVKRFYDRAFLIQAAKASGLTTSPYGSTGHQGGSTQVLANAADATDPALLVRAISRLYAKMTEKETVVEDGTILVVRPDVWSTLSEADHLINGEYITSEGNRLQNVQMLKYLGVPVVKSNQLPNTVVDSTDFVASVAGADFEGDFSRLVALAFNPKRALMAAQLIAPTSDIFYDKLSKSWYIDTDFSFNVKPNRPEFAGAVLLPTP